MLVSEFGAPIRRCRSVQELSHYRPQRLCGPGNSRGRPPSDEAIGTYEQAAVVFDLAYTHPLAQHVVVLLSKTDAVPLDGDAQFLRSLRRGVQPVLPADSRDDREGALPRQVDGGNALSVAFEPDMREIGPRVRRRVIVEIGIPRICRKRRPIADHRASLVTLAEFDAQSVELPFLHVQRPQQGLSAKGAMSLRLLIARSTTCCPTV